MVGRRRCGWAAGVDEEEQELWGSMQQLWRRRCGLGVTGVEPPVVEGAALSLSGGASTSRGGWCR